MSKDEKKTQVAWRKGEAVKLTTTDYVGALTRGDPDWSALAARRVETQSRSMDPRSVELAEETQGARMMAETHNVPGQEAPKGVGSSPPAPPRFPWAVETGKKFTVWRDGKKEELDSVIDYLIRRADGPDRATIGRFLPPPPSAEVEAWFDRTKLPPARVHRLRQRRRLGRAHVPHRSREQNASTSACARSPSIRSRARHGRRSREARKPSSGRSRSRKATRRKNKLARLQGKEAEVAGRLSLRRMRTIRLRNKPIVRRRLLRRPRRGGIVSAWPTTPIQSPARSRSMTSAPPPGPKSKAAILMAARGW